MHFPHTYPLAMINETQLDNQLSTLQEQTINNGGIWRFLQLPIPAQENFEDFLRLQSNTLELTPLPAEGIKTYLSEKIDSWSSYEGPSPSRRANSDEYERLRLAFLEDLLHFIESKGLKKVYRVEGLDFWIKTVIPSGTDQLSEEHIFHTENGAYLLHLGFSS